MPLHTSAWRTYAACARTDPTALVESADQLFHASYAQPDYLQNYDRDPIFDGVRGKIAPMLAEMAAIHRLPDPTAEYRRRFAPVATPGPSSR